MKEEWLFPGTVVPVDVETTVALVAEIHRLIDVVGSMALAQPEQKPMHPELRKMWEDYFDKCFRAVPERTWVGLMRGVRVDGDTVVITVKGGNDVARQLCGDLLNEMEAVMLGSLGMALFNGPKEEKNNG